MYIPITSRTTTTGRAVQRPVRGTGVKTAKLQKPNGLTLKTIFQAVVKTSDNKNAVKSLLTKSTEINERRVVRKNIKN
jgi:hypothetical protein